MSFLLKFLHSQLFLSLPYPEAEFSGQTVIVTGSNVGLGFEAAQHFTRLNAKKVILAVRSLEKGEAAKKSIEESTKRTGAVEVWQLDLSSYESVKQFVQRAEALERLDVIVENAGIATDKYKVFEDNESTITTNVVSTFLLALMILPKLRETSTKFNVTPHLVIVSSEVHYFTSFPERTSPNIFQTLNDKETANMHDRYVSICWEGIGSDVIGADSLPRYIVSKLLEVFFVRELASRTVVNSKPDVIINYLNPGLCHSELAKDGGWGIYLMKLLLARSTEYGSRTLVQAAEAGKESHGQYMSDCRVSQYVHDPYYNLYDFANHLQGHLH